MKRAPPAGIEPAACGLGILADSSAAGSVEAYSVNDGQDRNDSATTPPQAGEAATSARSDGTPGRRSTQVVNLRREPFDVYIGRAGKGQDGYFGNPYRVHRNLGADHLKKILDLYRSYFAHRIATDSEFRRRVLDLRGKRLGCFCKPGPCHGDVIAAWVESQPVERGANRTEARASLERGMENHRNCCGWRPDGERCGEASPGSGESICTRDPGHAGYHYDAARCVQWDRVGGAA